MHVLITILGAIGAWLLVAGPVYQAALELQEQEFDREGIDAVTSSVPASPKVSPWWWLFPPVAYLKSRKRSRERRAAVMDAMGPEQVQQTVDFLNKARGWLIVAGGASLILVKETWEAVEIFHWPIWLFVILLLVLALLAVGNAAGSLARSARMLKRDEEESAERRRGRSRGRT
jgi:hypothetical protein